MEENVPRDIPKEVALCLFRITQEALQNVKKHSRADSAEVRVEGLEQKIHLSISDRGMGFDQGALRDRGNRYSQHGGTSAAGGRTICSSLAPNGGH